jgi:hypothetical protein
MGFLISAFSRQKSPPDSAGIFAGVLLVKRWSRN